MPLTCVCSPKSSVGKTTLAANLSYSLARAGSKVLALDFDAQNALRLHFSVPLSDGRGYVAKSLELHDWSQCVLSAGGNIFGLSTLVHPLQPPLILKSLQKKSLRCWVSILATARCTASLACQGFNLLQGC